MSFWSAFFAKNINVIIVIIAVITAGILLYTLFIKREVDKELPKWEKEQDTNDLDQNYNIKERYNKLSKWYTIFITIITIFPLLGMLGTVSALLDLDMKNISNAQENFFSALSSTFLGIIFAILFKILNAVILFDVEDVIQRILKVIKDIRQEHINEVKKQKSGWRI